MSIEILILFIAASSLLSIAPGPDNIFVLTQSALYGRKSGILITLGLCTGLIFHTTLVALGVAAVIQASPNLFTFIKVLGAFYLVYLAWLAFRTSMTPIGQSASSIPLSNAALFQRGVIMNISNPKVTIFFLAFLPQFIVPNSLPVGLQIFILGGLFILVALAIFTTIATISAQIGKWLNQKPVAQIYLNRVAGLIYIALAIKLVFF